MWRVDLRLRPEGSSGPLVNSLSAAERYYETWGRLWERAALLRARVVAGSEVLGEQLAREIVVPFVFRREVDPTIGLLRDCIAEAEKPKSSDAYTRARLTQLLEFFELATSSFDLAEKLPTQSLLKAAKMGDKAVRLLGIGRGS